MEMEIGDYEGSADGHVSPQLTSALEGAWTLRRIQHFALPCHSHSPCSLQTLLSILQLSRQRDDPFLKVKRGVVDLQGAASATFCNVQLLLGKPPGQAQCGPGHVEVVCSSGDLRYHAGVGRPGFGFALRVSLHVMGSRNSTVY